MDIVDDMGVSKVSAKVFFFKVNYSFKRIVHPKILSLIVPPSCSKHLPNTNEDLFDDI